MYNITDLKRLNPPSKGCRFRLIKFEHDKDGRLQVPSLCIMPSVDTVLIPRRHFKDFNPETEDGDQLEEVLLEYFIGAPKPVTDSFTKLTTLQGTRGEIIFRYGTLDVKASDIALYNWLIYSNFCEDNEYIELIPGKTPIYRLLNPDRDLLKANELRKLRTRAVDMTFAMPDAELIEYARVLNIDVKRDIEIIRAHMAGLAEANPEQFITGTKSAERKYRALISESVDYRIIEYQAHTNEWNSLKIDEEGKTKRTLLTRVPQGEDAHSFFIRYLMKDNTGFFEHLMTLVAEKKDPKLKGSRRG